MPKRVADYGPGSLFTCKLPAGGWGAGLVVRWTEDRPIGSRAVTLYGFDGVYEVQPTFAQLASKTVFDAIIIGHSQCYPLRRGEWPVVGKLPDFTLAAWPEPAEVYDDRLGRIAWEQAWKAQGKPAPPMPKRDETISVATRVNRLGGKLLKARTYLKPHEFSLLPLRMGLHVDDSFRYALEDAIVRRHPLYYIKIEQAHLDVWERLRKTLRAKRVAYLGG